MSDLISRQDALDEIRRFSGYLDEDMINRIRIGLNRLPSTQPEIVRCKDCKHNPKLEWFGCPMSHLNEKQRPETAWCWKGERRTDADTEV